MHDMYISYGISYEKNDPFIIIYGNGCNKKKLKNGHWQLTNKV